jgi:hypothetical protein
MPALILPPVRATHIALCVHTLSSKSPNARILDLALVAFSPKCPPSEEHSLTLRLLPPPFPREQDTNTALAWVNINPSKAYTSALGDSTPSNPRVPYVEGLQQVADWVRNQTHGHYDALIWGEGDEMHPLIPLRESFKAAGMDFPLPGKYAACSLTLRRTIEGVGALPLNPFALPLDTAMTIAKSVVGAQQSSLLQGG